jgi:hypothetical protein
MKPATAPNPSRQETIQPTTSREPGAGEVNSRELNSRETESRKSESDVRLNDTASDSKTKTSPASSTSRTQSATPRTQSAVSQAPDEEQIRRRAYELYVEGGYWMET